jgi:hypothetical protein
MSLVEWIRLEIGGNPAEVLTRRPWREHNNSKEQYARNALDQIWDWPDTGPKPRPNPRGPAATAEAIRFVDNNGREVWRLTYEDVWEERRRIRKM